MPTVNGAHQDGVNQTFSIIGVIGNLGTADVAGTALTLPIGVNPSNGAMFVDPISSSPPTSGNNPSFVISYNAANQAVYVDETIGTTTTRKTLTRSDMTVTSTLPISKWI